MNYHSINISKIKQFFGSTLFHIFALVVIIFVSHFFLAKDFGIYEDDMAFVAHPFITEMTWQDFLVNRFSSWLAGRPVGEVIPAFLVLLFRPFNNLSLIYLAGSISIIINAVLFYFLVLRLSKIKTLAFIAAIIFTLFPADTTQLFLTHNLGLQYSITFLLIGFYLYLNNRKVLSYIFVCFLLLTYETPYWIFITAPLFSYFLHAKVTKRQIIIHSIIMIAIFCLNTFIRLQIGEDRASQFISSSINNFSILSIPLKAINSMFLGPLFSLFAFIYGPLDAIVHLTLLTLVVMIVSFLIILCFNFFTSSKHEAVEQKNIILEYKVFGNSISIESSDTQSQCIKMLILGIIAFPFSYLLSLHFYNHVINTGRMTSIHMAAAFPGALVVSAVLFLFFSYLKTKNRLLAIVVISFFFSVLIGYRFWIQQDFKLARLKITRMTTQIIEQIQDTANDTIIIVDAHQLEDTTYIESYNNQFIIHSMMLDLYYYNTPQRFFPKIILLNRPLGEVDLFFEDGSFYYDFYFRFDPEPYVLEDGNVIYIAWDGKRFVRQYGVLELPGGTIALREPGEDVLGQFEKTPVFDWFYRPELLDLEGPLSHDTLFN